jgi:hypothetical protein
MLLGSENRKTALFEKGLFGWGCAKLSGKWRETWRNGAEHRDTSRE